VHTITGFTNRSLRAQVATLLGTPYSSAQMSYDLTRLRLKGLIHRIPHTNTYPLTPDGQRIAIFYTKLYHRLLRPLTKRLGKSLRSSAPAGSNRETKAGG
jgi:hypothetical protein